MGWVGGWQEGREWALWGRLSAVVKGALLLLLLLLLLHPTKGHELAITGLPENHSRYLPATTSPPHLAGLVHHALHVLGVHALHARLQGTGQPPRSYTWAV